MPLAWITTSIVALEKEGEGGDMRNSNASQFKKKTLWSYISTLELFFFEDGELRAEKM